MTNVQPGPDGWLSTEEAWAADVRDSAKRPPRLLLTLLGDYWWQRTEPLPSAALVALLGEFGVSDSAARAALSRLARNELLVLSKHGRRTFHRLSTRAAQILDEGAQRIFSFGHHTQEWDGVWSLAAFSVPQDNPRSRYALRERLRWLGFAPLYDALWISPHDRVDEVVQQLDHLGIETATVFRATTVPGLHEKGFPQRAWDLAGLREEYQSFIAFAERLRDRIMAHRVSPVEALVARTRVMDRWRAFPAMDPELPDELLPEAWPRATARDLFITTYDLLGPLAAHRVRQIVGRYSPDLAAHATYHNSDARIIASDDAEQIPTPFHAETLAGPATT